MGGASYLPSRIQRYQRIYTLLREVRPPVSSVRRGDQRGWRLLRRKLEVVPPPPLLEVAAIKPYTTGYERVALPFLGGNLLRSKGSPSKKSG